ncbi:hypothetical protein FA893_15125 [Photobacterium damselae subsp. piscicida]|uniref:Uncharacterized protein n=2 Tax=Photobacterium damsela subsp. piscicida TaxID=38294 RepID=A0A4U0QYY7_PHODP|nr:hypothetical protein [Photobacterium damselae]MBE8128229.1 hypothetical protein [Photobacterium damselae subsp. piscicida]MDP2515907.1 hypothetical protein [Photobacterium damselae subsp. piscicida]MDP2557403.1 hypothetical protein [Photobacterium damselae subsp. piscicida]PSV80839.1 hypothetical protein CTT35_01235 [Photobacterium damselae]PSW85214.1 hypothetical protein CTT37_01235 [Photobacterium damselae]
MKRFRSIVMRVILLIICLSLLNGCLSTSANRDAAVQPLELFFSPEQTTLTAKQQQALQQFFTTYSYHQLEVSIGPADLSDRFQALLQGQKRIAAIEQLSQQKQIPLHFTFTPQQTADTLIIRQR